MKKTSLFVLCVCILFSANAQLGNTKWKTTLNMEGPVNVIFNFMKDSLVIYTISDSTIIEKMLFTDRDTVLTMQKTEGQSDCDNATIGKYHYTLNHDTIRISMVSDDCKDRSDVVDGTKWFRWKNHPEVHVDPAILKQYVGVYQLDPQHELVISLEHDQLMIEGPKVNLPKLPLLAESKTKFFLKVAGVEMDFIQDAQGKTIGLVSHEEKDYQLTKIK